MDTYASTLSRWKDSVCNPMFPTRRAWRDEFLKVLKNDDGWKRAMRRGLRGRPSLKHQDAIDEAIISANNDPLRLLYNCKVRVEPLLLEIERHVHLHYQHLIGDQLFRSKDYRRDVIASLEASVCDLAQAELFVFQRINSLTIKEEMQRCGVTPPGDLSARWVRFLIWALKNTGEERPGAPRKRDALDYLRHCLFEITNTAMKEVVASLQLSEETETVLIISTVRRVLHEPVRAVSEAAFAASHYIKHDLLVRDWENMLSEPPKRQPVTDTKVLTFKEAEALPGEEIKVGLKVKGLRPPFGGSWVYDKGADNLRLVEAPTKLPPNLKIWREANHHSRHKNARKKRP